MRALSHIGCIGLLTGCRGWHEPAPISRDPPVLTQQEHMGWKNPHCDACHELPVVGHIADQSPQCAACHGANGACVPVAVDLDHDPEQDCASCHGGQHGREDPADCVACHFAERGRSECGHEPGPTELVPDCFGWPDVEFDRHNNADIAPSIGVGQVAVDFTLRTPEGDPHTLSSLLQDKPVILIFGAFT